MSRRVASSVIFARWHPLIGLRWFGFSGKVEGESRGSPSWRGAALGREEDISRAFF